MKLKQGLFLSTLFLSLTLMTACGVNPATGSTNAITATPKPKTPTELVKSSDTAMKKLKYAHITFQSTINIDINGLPTTNDAAPTTIKELVDLKANDDTILPDQAQVDFSENITLGTTLQTMKSKIITQANKIYAQNKNGTWYVVDKTSSNSNFGDTNSANTFVIAEKSTFTDAGTETIAGVKVHHLVSTLDKEALNTELQQALGNLQGLGAQPDSSQSLLEKIQLDKPTLDLWIDSATSHLVQSDLKYNFSLDMSSLITPTPNATAAPTMSATADTKATYSNFDKKVTITPPTNAIPTTSLTDAFK